MVKWQMFCLSCFSSPTALACQASCRLNRPVISCIGGGQSSANINLYGEVANVLLELLNLSDSPGLQGLMPAQQSSYILQGIGGSQPSANINLYGEVNVLLELLQLSHRPGLVPAQQTGYILQGIGRGRSSANIKTQW